jgi:type VI secretion system secreted protein VgrG
MSGNVGYAATPDAPASQAADWSQEGRLIGIETPLGKDKLLLTSVNGEEALSELFVYDLQMLSSDDAITPESLIGRNAKVTILVEDGRKRAIHGVISQLRQGALIGRDFRIYHAQMVPWLWYLGQTTDCRIFQDKNVPDIIEEVFNTYGFRDYQISVLRGDYPKLEYCVQYRESALNFVSRLMEEVGIFYYFRHEQDRHVLIIGDANVSFRDLPDPQQSYAPGNLRSGNITEWEHRFDFRPGRWTQKDFNFKTPSSDLSVNEKTRLKLRNAEKFERFDYPGRYPQKAIGGKLTRTLMEAEESAYHVVRGTGNYRLNCVGGKFTVLHHPCEKGDTGYVVQRVRHEATDTSYLGNDAAPPHYENWFEAIPYDVPFRPLRVTEKPFVHGPQTAIVVGPPGEKIFTDSYGRVRVQFHWDRYGRHNDRSSCWIRVSHAWAGRGWGSVNLPHVGHEVVVSFLEGDPDCPLVTGRVYNGENLKTMGMPENKTQSGLKDHSGNEILMEGKNGSQDFRVHAVKDMHVLVDNDRDDHVKRNRSYTVDGTSTETIKQDTSITVTDGNYSHTVSTGTATIQVKGKVSETFLDAQETTVTKSITITSGTSNILIEAATDITLHVGASKLAMYADGRIELSGKAVAITGSDAVNVSGMSIKEEAGNDHSISGAIVMSSGQVSNTVKGAMVMLNP